MAELTVQEWAERSYALVFLVKDHPGLPPETQKRINDFVDSAPKAVSRPGALRVAVAALEMLVGRL